MKVRIEYFYESGNYPYWVRVHVEDQLRHFCGDSYTEAKERALYALRRDLDHSNPPPAEEIEL